jgi:hypothetical protein
MNRFARKEKGMRKVGKKSRNLYGEFIRDLEKNFGICRLNKESRSDSPNQVAVTYGSKIPPSMPVPHGPTSGAHYTMRQYVQGSDMTLATGSAIVGALVRQGGSTEVYAAWSFALADVPNLGSVTALFDKYRFDRIHFRLRSRNNSVATLNVASPNNSGCTMLVVRDPDDSAAPTTLGELKQYSNCQVISTQDSIDIIFEPTITVSVFSGGVFSGYSVKSSSEDWLDVANTTIPHYGIKLGISALAASTTSKIDWDVEAWYQISFQDTR